MIERVLHPRNMQRALQQVIANKGSAGVDGMNVQELSDYLRKEKTRLYSLKNKVVLLTIGELPYRHSIPNISKLTIVSSQ